MNSVKVNKKERNYVGLGFKFESPVYFLLNCLKKKENVVDTTLHRTNGGKTKEYIIEYEDGSFEIRKLTK